MEEKMYKAKIEIGGYKIGDEVPAQQAEVWAKMYKESPVELVGDETSDKPDEESNDKPDETQDDAPVENAMHDDYLNRNADVVKKALSEDDLDKKTLISLSRIETEGKKRKPVITAIEEKIKSL